MYDMDEEELEALIAKQEYVVAKLNCERPGSPELDFEAGILKDAKELLGERRKKNTASDEVQL